MGAVGGKGGRLPPFASSVASVLSFALGLKLPLLTGALLPSFTLSLPTPFSCALAAGDWTRVRVRSVPSREEEVPERESEVPRCSFFFRCCWASGSASVQCMSVWGCCDSHVWALIK